MEQDLSAKPFDALNPAERVKLCRRRADEATALAEHASPNFRAAYMILAVDWLVLADEIARAAVGVL